MSVNKVILLGYVGSDPDIRFPQPDFCVAYLSLATNETYGNPPTEVTEWHNLVLTGNLGRLAERYIRKGSRIYVEGKLKTREYEDKLKIRRRRTEIYADKVELLGRSEKSNPQS